MAENPHGSDSVTWRVYVLRPPTPPGLALIEARSRELELELRPAPRAQGHALPKAYTLHWRLAAPEVSYIFYIRILPSIMTMSCKLICFSFSEMNGPLGK